MSEVDKIKNEIEQHEYAIKRRDALEQLTQNPHWETLIVQDFLDNHLKMQVAGLATKDEELHKVRVNSLMAASCFQDYLQSVFVLGYQADSNLPELQQALLEEVSGE